MRQLLAALCAAFLFTSGALAQNSVLPQVPPNYVLTGLNYKHITTLATTAVKATPGVLHTVCIGTAGATGTITIYDNTSASGAVISIITMAAGDEGKCLNFDVVFTTGLTIVTATVAGDITVSYL